MSKKKGLTFLDFFSLVNYLPIYSFLTKIFISLVYSFILCLSAGSFLYFFFRIKNIPQRLFVFIFRCCDLHTWPDVFVRDI